MTSAFTCISCQVMFSSGELQRAHYKTDWHRYNLKRKVANLPPISAESFQKKVLSIQEAQGASEEAEAPTCDLCNKHFSSDNAYQNHLLSKKHKESEQRDPEQPVKRKKKAPRIYRRSTSAIELGEEKEADWEDVKEMDEGEYMDEDDLEEDPEGEPLLVHECLFCSKPHSNVNENVSHMSSVHSFFAPDSEFLIDQEGLVRFLGEKVGGYLRCLWCGKRFRSLMGVQMHMQDKGHCMIKMEDTGFLEIADFYDYRSSYPDFDPNQVESSSSDVPDEIDGTGFELMLPSGARVGHRSLRRFFRQNVPENRIRPAAPMRAIGWMSPSVDQAKRARDVLFWQRWKSRNYMRLGVKANKLQKHFREQVLQ